MIDNIEELAADGVMVKSIMSQLMGDLMRADCHIDPIQEEGEDGLDEEVEADQFSDPHCHRQRLDANHYYDIVNNEDHEISHDYAKDDRRRAGFGNIVSHDQRIVQDYRSLITPPDRKAENAIRANYPINKRAPEVINHPESRLLKSAGSMIDVAGIIAHDRLHDHELAHSIDHQLNTSADLTNYTTKPMLYNLGPSVLSINDIINNNNNNKSVANYANYPQIGSLLGPIRDIIRADYSRMHGTVLQRSQSSHALGRFGTQINMSSTGGSEAPLMQSQCVGGTEAPPLMQGGGIDGSSCLAAVNNNNSSMRRAISAGDLGVSMIVTILIPSFLIN
jgi:hypothetical protein